MKEHYFEFNIELNLSDTVETEKGISELQLEDLKKDMKHEFIYNLKEYLRQHTTYEVAIN